MYFTFLIQFMLEKGQKDLSNKTVKVLEPIWQVSYSKSESFSLNFLIQK